MVTPPCATKLIQVADCHPFLDHIRPGRTSMVSGRKIRATVSNTLNNAGSYMELPQLPHFLAYEPTHIWSNCCRNCWHTHNSAGSLHHLPSSLKTRKNAGKAFQPTPVISSSRLHMAVTRKDIPDPTKADCHLPGVVLLLGLPVLKQAMLVR